MKSNSLHIVLLLLCIVLVASCSVKKNTGTTRFYHSFTTRYNVYFNGIENYKEQLKLMQDNYEDNYTRMIHMHPVSAFANEKEAKPAGSFDRTIEKCQKAIRLHSIKKRPKKDRDKMNDPKYREYVNRDEYNPFIHNAWVLMGQAQFYKGDFLGASATFIYITRHFTWKPELVAEARIWLARCYLEMGWLYEAEDVLQKINNDGLPASQNNWFATVNTDYLLKKGSYKQAIPFLKTAIKVEKNKKQRIRMTFLLAQLYEQTGDFTQAYDAFGKVIKMSPVYRTEFNARIKQTEVFAGKDINKVIKSLNRMTKAERNKDYLDQIYYAKGNLYLSRKDTVKAIENYVLAAEKSTRDGIEKAVSQVKLGGIYFVQGEYVKAQPCYAEAMPQLDDSYPNYKELLKRSEVLDELVVYAQNVELQDSLQHLAMLPEPDRMKAIQSIIDEIERKEKEAADEAKKQAYLEEQQSMGNANMQNNNGAKQPVVGGTMPGGENAWYFYNTSLVSSGKTEFQRRWGRRKLEDNWRRRNKSGFSMTDFSDTPAEGENADTESSSQLGDVGNEGGGDGSNPEEAVADSLADNPKNPAFYLKQLPKTPEDFAVSNEIITDGLYNMGLILKNKLEDFPSSISTFNKLDSRFPENEFRLDVYYNMYLMYTRMGNNLMADHYKQLIIKTFPESKHAVAMKDPDYLNNLRNMDIVQDSIYAKTYQAYLNNNNAEVHRAYEYVSQKYPLSKLLPKFMFLHSLAYVSERNVDGFKDGLKKLLTLYPDADVSPLASDMLKGVTQGRTVSLGGGNNRGMIWKLRLSRNAGDSLELASDTTIAPFAMDKNAPHLLVLVYATDSVSSNQLLFNVAKYNFSNFLIKDFDLEIISFNEITMLVVKGFNNFDELTQYRKMMGGENGITLPEAVRPVMISDSNFKILLDGRSFEEYFKFLENNQ